MCHHTWLFAWVLETEFRDGGGLSSNALPAELSPHVRETAFYLSNPETLIIISEALSWCWGLNRGSLVGKVKHSINSALFISHLPVVFGTAHRPFWLANFCISLCLGLFFFLESYVRAANKSTRIWTREQLSPMGDGIWKVNLLFWGKRRWVELKVLGHHCGVNPRERSSSCPQGLLGLRTTASIHCLFFLPGLIVLYSPDGVSCNSQANYLCLNLCFRGT